MSASYFLLTKFQQIQQNAEPGFRKSADASRSQSLKNINSPVRAGRVAQLFATRLKADVVVTRPKAPVKDKDEVARYSTHSLRVGACQILYANGFRSHEIKMLLRWQSDAFMVYLRDIAWVARKQVDAMNEIAKDIFNPFL